MNTHKREANSVDLTKAVLVEPRILSSDHTFWRIIHIRYLISQRSSLSDTIEWGQTILVTHGNDHRNWFRCASLLIYGLKPDSCFQICSMQLTVMVCQRRVCLDITVSRVSNLMSLGFCFYRRKETPLVEGERCIKGPKGSLSCQRQKSNFMNPSHSVRCPHGCKLTPVSLLSEITRGSVVNSSQVHVHGQVQSIRSFLQGKLQDSAFVTRICLLCPWKSRSQQAFQLQAPQ